MNLYYCKRREASYFATARKLVHHDHHHHHCQLKAYLLDHGVLCDIAQGDLKFVFQGGKTSGPFDGINVSQH